MSNDASNALAELIGQQVEVTSLEGQDRFLDSGTLESYLHPWIYLRKKNGELLCFPAYNVRLIKAVGK
jgi:hypothetical protein